MAGPYGVADGTGPLLLHTSGTTTGGITTAGTTTGVTITGGITTAGTVTSTATSGSSTVSSGLQQAGQLFATKLGIAKILPGISFSSASAGTGFGILAGLGIVGGVLLTGAVFAGVGLLSYGITKAAIEPE